MDAFPSGRECFDAVMRAVRLRRPPAVLPPLARLRCPSLEEFRRFRGSEPVILTGLIDEQISDWSMGRLRERFGDRVISVIPTDEGRMRSDARTGVIFETTRFGDFVDLLDRGESPKAYVVAPGESFLPELIEAIPPPAYCRDARWRLSRFWLSEPQTSTPLHHDVAENLFFQLIGRKRFYLYAPAASAWLYSNPFRSALPNFSRFDPERPDYERFPLAEEIRAREVVLAPGDALYLPSRWWHQVRSLDMSASFNFWFADGALALAVRAAERFKRSRKLEIYGLEARLRMSGQLAGS